MNKDSPERQSASDQPPFRRAKIICTIGPSSGGEPMLRELMQLGMDVARLNFSHGSHADHARSIENLRRIANDEGRTICILQDLQGPKIRTGALQGHQPVVLKAGATVTITAREVEGTAELIATTFKDLPQEVSAGSRILLSDGRIELQVREVRGPDVECQVINGGALAEHQGINLPGAALSIPALTEKDRKDLEFGLGQGVDAVAISFVRSAADVQMVKDIITARQLDVPVIAKLEKPQAVDHLEEILELADGVMVARGDLGVEMPPEKVPVIQKHVIRRAAEWCSRPCSRALPAGGRRSASRCVVVSWVDSGRLSEWRRSRPATAPAWAASPLARAGSPAARRSATSCARSRGRSQTRSLPRVDFFPRQKLLVVHVHRVPPSTFLRCFTNPELGL